MLRTGISVAFWGALLWGALHAYERIERGAAALADCRAVLLAYGVPEATP